MPDLQMVLSLISQIQEARNYRGVEEAWGATIGECDWTGELLRQIDNDRPQDWWK